jgi:hypothetical protein
MPISVLSSRASHRAGRGRLRRHAGIRKTGPPPRSLPRRRRTGPKGAPFRRRRAPREGGWERVTNDDAP